MAQSVIGRFEHSVDKTYVLTIMSHEAKCLHDMAWDRACQVLKPEAVAADTSAASLVGLGVLLVETLNNREAVLRAAAHALEEMNYHQDAAQLRKQAETSPDYLYEGR